MTALYNEIDPYCAQWLRNLIEAGHIAPGVVDERSIEDITPNELREYTQVHCFAGIGVWSYALRLAGWPDDRPVWTGSCPCQPFSAAGKGNGFADERHLWPAWFHLIRECNPGVVFGEQVASRDGLGWLDLVHADLEGAGYACGAVDLCAAGVGAPHIRQRLWFVADANGATSEWRAGSFSGAEAPQRSARQFHGHQPDGFADGREARGLADADGGNARAERQQRGGQYRQQPTNRVPCIVGNPDDKGLEKRRSGSDQQSSEEGREAPQRPAGLSSFWSNAEWIDCRDGKRRPVEPGTFPLAHGIANRVGRLRAYGNCIAAPAAEVFIRSVMECVQ